MTSLCFTDQETQEENLQGGTSSLVGQFLHPISLVQSSRSMHSVHADSPIVPKQNSFLVSVLKLDVGPANASQIKKLRKRICRVEPAPLWASSYTQYLLYKVQAPFSACRQSNCSETVFSYLMPVIWMYVGSVYASQIKKLRRRICRVEPAPLWASSYTHLLYKARDPFRVCRLFRNKGIVYICANNLADVGPVSASQINKLRKRIFRVERAPLWASSYIHIAQDTFNAYTQSKF